MKSINECIRTKDMKGLAMHTYRHNKSRQAKENKLNDDNFTAYMAANTEKIRKRTKDYKYSAGR